MTDLFDHFLITRFNIRMFENKLDKNNANVLTEEWLEHRLLLFEKYCLPSVVAQTNKHFFWLIYLSNDTPNISRDRIEKMVEPYTNIIYLRYVADQEEFTNAQPIDIKVLSNKPYIITTRVDNDDCIHQNFIDRIQREFNKQDFIPVNMLKILSLKIEGKNRLYLNFAYSGHYISIIEKMSPHFRGCYSRKDKDWRNEKNIVQIQDDIYCLELIHTRNLANDMFGFPYYRPNVLKNFQIKYIKQVSFDFSDLFFWRMPWKKVLLSFLK